MRVVDLFETFDSMYNVVRTGDKHWFITEDGETFYVQFKGDSTMVEVFLFMMGHPNVRIDLGKRAEAFESQRALKVLSTVSHIVSEYLRKNHPDQMLFTGSGQLGELYEKILQRQSNAYRGYDLQIHKSGRDATFVFTKK